MTPKVKMVQHSKHKWCIKTATDKVLQDDIVISSQFEAEEYVKKYISSFMGWTYDILPLVNKEIKK
jgi:hypothetical protein